MLLSEVFWQAHNEYWNASNICRIFWQTICYPSLSILWVWSISCYICSHKVLRSVKLFIDLTLCLEVALSLTSEVQWLLCCWCDESDPVETRSSMSLDFISALILSLDVTFNSCCDFSHGDGGLLHEKHSTHSGILPQTYFSLNVSLDGHLV